MKQTRAFSNCKHVAVFPQEFSVLPQKTSAYLRADFPSGANTREIRALSKHLYNNDLRPEAIFQSHKMHHFCMRYGPFQGMKHTISHPETNENGSWNWLKRKARWSIRHSAAGYMTRPFIQNMPPKHTIQHLLTPLSRFSFVKKKSRKSADEVTPKSWTC